MSKVKILNETAMKTMSEIHELLNENSSNLNFVKRLSHPKKEKKYFDDESIPQTQPDIPMQKFSSWNDEKFRLKEEYKENMQKAESDIEELVLSLNFAIDL